MRLTGRVLLTIALFMAVETAFACFAAKRGSGWDADELIDHSESIMLAILVEKEVGPEFETKFRLKRIEAIKGDAPEYVEFFGYSKEYHGNHFNSHVDEKFWSDDIGRSPFPCCICGPAHTFIEGETYLLFPDAFGAIKSAEIVGGPDDRWLRYVRESLSKD